MLLKSTTAFPAIQLYKNKKSANTGEHNHLIFLEPCSSTYFGTYFCKFESVLLSSWKQRKSNSYSLPRNYQAVLQLTQVRLSQEPLQGLQDQCRRTFRYHSGIVSGTAHGLQHQPGHLLKSIFVLKSTLLLKSMIGVLKSIGAYPAPSHRATGMESHLASPCQCF